jgi:hypothetical protein
MIDLGTEPVSFMGMLLSNKDRRLKIAAHDSAEATLQKTILTKRDFASCLGKIHWHLRIQQIPLIMHEQLIDALEMVGKSELHWGATFEIDDTLRTALTQLARNRDNNPAVPHHTRLDKRGWIHVAVDASTSSKRAGIVVYHATGGSTIHSVDIEDEGGEIATLEMRAALEGIIAAGSDNNLRIITDNMVVYHAIRRWGSSSATLRATLRKIHALTENRTIEVRYAPSEANPADPPSRCKTIDDKVRAEVEARSAVTRTLIPEWKF